LHRSRQSINADVVARGALCGDASRARLAPTAQERAKTMITEIAQIDVEPGMEAEFETSVKNAAPLTFRAFCGLYTK
jgi:hypothetical protein